MSSLQWPALPECNYFPAERSCMHIKGENNSYPTWESQLKFTGLWRAWLGEASSEESNVRILNSLYRQLILKSSGCSSGYKQPKGLLSLHWEKKRCFCKSPLTGRWWRSQSGISAAASESQLESSTLLFSSSSPPRVQNDNKILWIWLLFTQWNNWTDTFHPILGLHHFSLAKYLMCSQSRRYLGRWWRKASPLSW